MTDDKLEKEVDEAFEDRRVLMSREEAREWLHEHATPDFDEPLPRPVDVMEDRIFHQRLFAQVLVNDILQLCEIHEKFPADLVVAIRARCLAARDAIAKL